MVKLHDKVASTREVDATVQAAQGEQQTHHDDEAEHDIGGLLGSTHEVELHVLHQVAGELGVEGHVVEGALVDEVLHHEACSKHGGEERAADTDYQGNGKTADGTGTQQNQDDTGDDGGQVGVEDGRERILVTVADGGLQALAGAQLLLATLKDKHVGIHRHTQGEHNTGDTGQGKHALERGEDTDGEEQVEDQTQVGNVAGVNAIGANHEDHQQNQCHDERDETLADGLLTQRRTNHTLAGHIDTCHHLTRLEHVGKVTSLLDGEAAADLRATTVDLAIDVGERVNLVVENDGDSLTDVLTGDAAPLTGALIVHGHRHDLTLQVVKLAGSAGNDVTVQDGLAVNRAQCDELEHLVATLHLLGLYGPSELQVGGEDRLSDRRVDDGIDSSGVTNGDITQNGRAGLSACQRLEAHELSQGEFTLLGGGSLLGSLGGTVGSSLDLGGSGGVGSGLLGLSNRLVGLSLVAQLTQCANDVGQRVGLVEFQVSGTLQQLAHALGLFHARELKQDASSALQLLDIGLYHAKAVDTVAQHLVGVVHHSVDLVVEDALHLAVRGVGLLLHALDVAEDLRQAALGSQLLVLLAEGAHEVVLSGLAAHHVVDGLVKLLVGIVVRKGAQDVGHRDLQCHIHTTLQVKAEAQLFLTNLLEGVVSKVHLLVGEGVQTLIERCLVLLVAGVGTLDAGSGESLLLGHVLVVIAHKRERQIEGANQQQCNGKDSNKTFSLHLIC